MNDPMPIPVSIYVGTMTRAALGSKRRSKGTTIALT